MAPDDQLLRAAAFLGRALDLDEAPALLAEDLVLVEADEVLAVFAAELDSSAGPAAFLVYSYDLAATDDEGRRGRERFEGDLATLETAAAQDVPGPRAVAHALTDEDAFILATSPVTLRALAGEAESSKAAAAPSALASAGDPTETRRAAAAELLRLLRLADAEAAAWLDAVAASRGDDSAGVNAVGTSRLALTPEETELALVLLDDGARQLLRALNALLSEAQDRVAAATRSAP